MDILSSNYRYMDVQTSHVLYALSLSNLSPRQGEAVFSVPNASIKPDSQSQIIDKKPKMLDLSAMIGLYTALILWYFEQT